MLMSHQYSVIGCLFLHRYHTAIDINTDIVLNLLTPHQMLIRTHLVISMICKLPVLYFERQGMWTIKLSIFAVQIFHWVLFGLHASDKPVLVSTLNCYRKVDVCICKTSTCTNWIWRWPSLFLLYQFHPLTAKTQGNPSWNFAAAIILLLTSLIGMRYTCSIGLLLMNRSLF